MSRPLPIRLLLADDHALVRVGISSVLALEQDIEVVAEAATGRDAVALYREHRPDVALLDVRMPGTDGIAALREIRGSFPDACVVMLSTSGLADEVAQAIDGGARGYLLKTRDAQALADCIRRAVAGERQFPPGAQERLACRAPLAPREVEVLAGMARGLSNKEIASLLHLSPHTVKDYVKGVLSKLQVPDRAGAVAAGFEQGILKV